MVRRNHKGSLIQSHDYVVSSGCIKLEISRKFSSRLETWVTDILEMV